MTTRATYKLRLALAILLLAMSAHAARSAGVSWINQDDRHTGQDRLVNDKAAKLIEIPTVVPCPLSLSYPGPRSNTAQVFEGNRSLRALGFLNKGLADAVVHVGTEPTLFAGEAFQVSLGRVRSNRL